MVAKRPSPAPCVASTGSGGRGSRPGGAAAGRACRVTALVVMLVASTLSVATAGAAVPFARTWVGPSGGLWSTPLNWSPVGVPASGDTLVFDAQGADLHTVADLSVSLTALETSSSATGNTYVDPAPGGAITLTGDLTVRGGNLVVGVPVHLPAGQHTFEARHLGLGLTGAVSGAGGIATTGPGWVSLSGPTTYGGATSLGAAHNIVYAGTSLGSVAVGTTVTDGASLMLFRSDAQAGFAEPLRLIGSGNSEGDATLELLGDLVTAPIELVGDVVVGASGGELAGPISGTGRLVSAANGLTVSSADNAYSGGTLVANTTMRVTASGALGTGPVEVASRSLALVGDITLANPIVLHTPHSPLLAVAGDSQLSGGITPLPDFPGCPTRPEGIDVAAEASLSLRGGFHGAEGSCVAKTGDGVLVVEGSQPSTGGGLLEIAGGPVVLAATPGTATLPHYVWVSDGATLLTVAPDQLRGSSVSVFPDGVLDLLGYDQTLEALGSLGYVALGYEEDGGVDFATLTAQSVFLRDAIVSMLIGAGGSDQIVVSGRAELDAPFLDVTVAGEVPLGHERVIVRAGSVQGRFANLDDGQSITLGGRAFRSSYRGGDGNDISLTRADQPPPTTTTTAPPTTTTTTSPTTTFAPTPATPPARSGYWMVGADGTVYAFGGAPWLGNAPVGATRAEDLEPTPSGRGYWVADGQGHVFAFGDAGHLGGLDGRLGMSEAVTSISATPTGRGYWLFTTLGRVVAFGDATFVGDMSASRLNGPVLGSVPTPTGRGYYMVAADGGIFAFGDAAFVGSMGGAKLNAPVQSLVPDGDGKGYWLVAADGGIFAFSAPFHGSMGHARLNKPITGMVASASTGYLMVGEDGGIFAFGSARFHGSLGDHPPVAPVTSVAVLPA